MFLHYHRPISDTYFTRKLMLANRWTMLGMLFLVRTSMGFQFQSIASVSPLLIEDLAIGYTEIGTLIGLFMLPGVVIALPGGLLGKRFGDKRVCAIGLALMVVGGILVGISQSYVIAFAGRLLSGIGAVLFNVVLTKMVADWFAGKGIVKAFGVMLSAWPFGIALGLVSQSILAATYSWQIVMYLTAGGCAVGLGVVTALYHAPQTWKGSSLEDASTRFRVPMRELLPVSMAGLAWGAFNAGLVIFFSFTPALLTTQGWSAVDAGSLVSLGLWVSILSLPLGGYLTERIGFTNAIVVIFSLVTAGALFLLPYLPFPVVLSVLVGLSIGPPAGAIAALPAQTLSPENRGPGLGIFYSWYYLAMAVGPVFAGLARDLSGSVAVPVLIGGAMFVATTLFIILFHLSRSKVAAAEPSLG